ncbi:50s ribosomal protein l1 [Scedosporium apiospermum]|uniref:50s ribosomal protein l1 n=1 Tax=Pseudallescheria apiosperma TaxID=563466 RepID=A0A084FXG1_PSEDA|nr:50s ribosomal protein l1 [Scedosporium apiospermum]KEZ39773.1 50s ribosomal protein l1 [Scedosporium apiospermum]
MARLTISSTQRPLATQVRQTLIPSITQVRYASGKSKKKTASKAGSSKKAEKKKLPKHFKSFDPTEYPQFSLCDAIRYLRAYEVGKRPLGVKYELSIRLKTMRNGPVVRDTIKLPHPITSGERFGVICPEGSEIAVQALQAGATVAGEESVFERIRNGDMPFERLLCHEDSENALKQANLGRLLGPKGLMPSRKLGTITNNIRKTMTSGASEYRERVGVVRMVVGEVGFTPRMVADNVAAMVKEIKSRCTALEDLTEKAVSEVVLSSTHGPGFNLNGKFQSTDPNVKEEDLAGVM